MNTDGQVRLLTSRIRELAVRRGRLRRRRAEVATDPKHLACVDAAISRIGDEIGHRRDHLDIVACTGSYQPWTHHHFRIGDFARIGGAWYPVLHAGWTALTIPPLDLLGERRHHPNGGKADTDSVAYFRVYGRRRAGRLLHTPPPPETATCTSRLTIPTFNPQFVPQRDAGPCTQAGGAADHTARRHRVRLQRHVPATRRRPFRRRVRRSRVASAVGRGRPALRRPRLRAHGREGHDRNTRDHLRGPDVTRLAGGVETDHHVC